MMMKNPIDQPFRSREEIELEAALVAQYRQIGNPELLDTIAGGAKAAADEETAG
jgi:hypothetical protein